MLHLLLGLNEYAKKQYINALVKEKGAELVVFGEGEEISTSQLMESDLFSKAKVFALKQLPDLSNLNKLVSTPNQIVVEVKTLDKRKKENKDLLANAKVIVKEFLLPHGKELDKWILNRVSALGGNMSNEAASELAIRLGRDQAKETKFGGKVVSVEEIYSLNQAESEIQKLLAYASGREVTKDYVEQLVSENAEVDALEITNALAEKNKDLSFVLIDKFLKDQTASDEKGSIIQLNALLAEQFRNVGLVQEFLKDKASENLILEKTGWKSGRLFVMRKIAQKFEPKVVLESLSKLASLDEELKTSQTPPRVLLDLILAQLF